MKRRLILWFGIVPVVALGIALLIPSDRYFLLGLLRGESFQDGRPTSYWIDQLKEADAGKRQEAAAALGRIGPEAKKGVPALALALKDSDKLVRLKAALALFQIGAESADAVPALCDALQDEIPLVRLQAALALRLIGPKAGAAVPALIQALRDPENRIPQPGFLKSVAQVAAMALGRIGPDAKDAIAALAEIAYDKESDELLRQEAAEALKKIDPHP